MCGISGFLCAHSDQNSDQLASVARMMNQTLVHRGPDAGDIWIDAEPGIALAHRRLSIIELSSAGAQPMHSKCGRYVLIFNGEIYNHMELRQMLTDTGEQVQWQGHSDTESLLEAIARWGLCDALKRATGMFALALWDRRAQTLTLARDRLGEKPLYYGWQGDVLMFASELKALKVHPSFSGDINREALTLFLRYSYVPGPYSIFRGIYKLQPGAFVILQRGMKEAEPECYWSATDCVMTGQQYPFTGTTQEATDELELLLTRSIKGQMLADVPLGAFLSGGIDSSSVVALMQKQSSQAVKTFSIGFHQAEYDEAGHAKSVANYLGTDHTELYVTPQEARAVIPELPQFYDEPFADVSQIPTFLVSQLARQHVTVSLSGDGGDELFGGYSRYYWVDQVRQRIGWVPHSLRRIISNLITTAPPQSWNRLFSLFGNILPSRYRYSNPGDKMHKLAGVMAMQSPDNNYHELVSHWTEPGKIVLDAHEPLTAITDPSNKINLPDLRQRMMFLDLITCLPDDILVKLDRAAMSVSLETRVPFLDHHIVEFAWRLPVSMKYKNGKGKWLLRQLLYRHVPQQLVDRPKMGFSLPIDAWLRGPLKEWAESLLNPSRLNQEGFFDAVQIHNKWQEHLSGKRNWHYQLWDVLMFQAWREHWYK